MRSLDRAAEAPPSWGVDGAEVAVLDAEGVIVAVNDAWARFCAENGGDPQRCGIGVSYLDACDGAAGDPYADAVATAVRAALTGGTGGRRTVTVPCHSLQARRWFHVEVTPRPAGGGRGAVVAVLPADPLPALVPTVGMPDLRDVLDVLDLVPDPVLVVDPDLQVAHANLGAATWLGWAPDHLVGMSLADLDPCAGDAPDVLSWGGDGVVSREFRARDGSRRPCETRVRPLVEHGRRRFVLVAHDVREREVSDDRRSREARLAARRADITTALLEGSEPEGAYALVAEAAAEITRATDAAVVLPGPDGQLARRAVVGDAAHALNDDGVPFSAAIAAVVLGRGRGVSFRAAPGVDPRVRDVMGPVAASPVVVADRAHGLIAVARPRGADPFDDVDLDLLDRLAVQLGLVVQTVRARADRQHLAVLQDRQRIARDLHDTVIQDLIGLGMHLHAEARAEDDETRRVQDEQIVDHLDRTVRALRAAVFQLRDTPLGSTTSASVEQLIAEASRALDHVPSLRLAGAVDDLPAELSREVFAVLREAMSNVARHAAATQTTVTLAVDGDRLRICVEDDGTGPSGEGSGTGLANLRDRAAALGGDTGLDARPTGGARLWWECPLPTSFGQPVGRLPGQPD